MPDIVKLCRRSLLSILAAAGLVAAPGMSRANQTVLIGTPGRLSDNSLAVKVALDSGFYRAAGLDVQIVDFEGGARAVQALIGSGIQFAIVAPEHVIRLRNRGVDGEVALALQDHQSYALLAAPSSTIKSFADLKGHRIGITSPGSLTENLVHLAARKAGLVTTSDIELVTAGLGPTQKAAIDGRSIDAGMFANVDVVQLQQKNYKIVYDWRQMQEPSLALVTLGRWASAHPTLARAVIEATFKAQKLILSHPAVGAKALASLYPAVLPATITKLADSLHTQLSPDPRFSQGEFETLQNDVLESEPSLHRIEYGLFQIAQSAQ